MQGGEANTREGGFSLIELLVAVFVMGLVSTAIILTAPKRPDPAAAAAERLSGLVSDLVNGAVLTGETRSLLVEPSAIRFQTWREGAWQDQKAAPVRLAAAVRAEDANRKLLTQDSEKALRIIADRTGMVQASEINLIGRQETWRLKIAEDGSTTTERSDG